MYLENFMIIALIIITLCGVKAEGGEREDLIFIQNPVESMIPGHWVPESVMKELLAGKASAQTAEKMKLRITVTGHVTSRSRTYKSTRTSSLKNPTRTILSTSAQTIPSETTLHAVIAQTTPSKTTLRKTLTQTPSKTTKHATKFHATSLRSAQTSPSKTHLRTTKSATTSSLNTQTTPRKASESTTKPNTTSILSTQTTQTTINAINEISKQNANSVNSHITTILSTSTPAKTTPTVRSNRADTIGYTTTIAPTSYTEHSSLTTTTITSSTNTSPISSTTTTAAKPTVSRRTKKLKPGNIPPLPENYGEG
ncbi:cell wall protein DAN4-like [Aricia agestis]|uniref:cell wall protein DAN4-like n=1 Tax=Aricia agestis TaxID=91739 RepID=UPI001C20AA76|nr:cell wall protein DAN4-like [Aricia agestis]